MRKGLLTGLALVLAACGDPATEDPRAYTKAPLENPGLAVAGEPESALGVRADLEPGLVGWTPEAERERAAEAEQQATPEEEGPEVSLASGVSQEQFEQGRELFTGTGGCMACHGTDAAGSQLGPDLTDAEWLNLESPDVAAVAGLIRDGVSDPREYPAPMPAMGGANLSEEQVQALAGYVASIAGG